MLGPPCCVRDFSSCSKRGLLLVAVHRLLSLQNTGSWVCSLQDLRHEGSAVAACGLYSMGSVVVLHRL